MLSASDTVADRPVGTAGNTVQSGVDGSDEAAALNAVTRKHHRRSGVPPPYVDVEFVGTVNPSHEFVRYSDLSTRNPSSLAELSFHLTRILFPCGTASVSVGARIGGGGGAGVVAHAALENAEKVVFFPAVLNERTS